MNKNGKFCKDNKKVHWFFSYVCNGKFAVCWVLCCRITCKRVLFPGIGVYFYQLAQIIEMYNRPITACIVKTATEAQCLCSTSEKASSCFFISHHRILFAPQLIVQSSVWNDQRIRQTSNTSSYSISSRVKQLFKFAEFSFLQKL